jgi:hypothetical protein
MERSDREDTIMRTFTHAAGATLAGLALAAAAAPWGNAGAGTGATASTPNPSVTSQIQRTPTSTTEEMVLSFPFQGGHQRLINRGPKSIGPGDLFLSTGMPVLDTATGHRIGTSDATELIVSTRHDGTVLGQSTLRLRGGHVELDGVVRHTDSPFRVSITGGTGRYLGVGGQLTMLREDDVHKAVVMKLELIH